jgi:hypothetical protein
MTAELDRRRRVELVCKAESLRRELEHWKTLTDDERRGMRRHNSQVQRLASVLDGLMESVRNYLDGLPAQQSVIDKATSQEERLLAAHSIWEVFRSKLVLREDDLFRVALVACDDLAWECYKPAVAKFDPCRKGPPLVYFSATWSPFMMPRDSSFANEVRAGPGAAGALREDGVLEILKRLPVPLIGVPWYHMVHLPGALVIAHEVGHVVETDFDLTQDIAGALSGAQLDHAEAWQAWASEVFADLYGCLCMGPAFVGAMMDLLTTTVSAVRGEKPGRGRYPTRALRIELMLAALTQVGQKEDAIRLRKTWEEVYGADWVPADYLNDVAKVVPAIFEGHYRGVALTEIAKYNCDSFADRQIGQAAALGRTDILKLYEDPRRLFAGAQWLHENPQPQKAADPYRLIAEQIGKRYAAVYRNRAGEAVTKAALDADTAACAETDRRSGRELAALLAPRDQT